MHSSSGEGNAAGRSRELETRQSPILARFHLRRGSQICKVPGSQCSKCTFWCWCQGPCLLTQPLHSLRVSFYFIFYFCKCQLSLGWGDGWSCEMRCKPDDLNLIPGIAVGSQAWRPMLPTQALGGKGRKISVTYPPTSPSQQASDAKRFSDSGSLGDCS